MTDQTPTTEDVRLLNVLTVALADAAQEDDNNFIPFTKRTHYANAIMAHLEEHRAAHDRAVKAEAWAEGQDAGFGACENGGSYTANPYRIEADRG